jgi:hypothetical protein
VGRQRREITLGLAAAAPQLTDYDRRGGAPTPLHERRSGEIGRRAGLKSQRDSSDNNSGDTVNADSDANTDTLAPLLDMEPDLRELVDVWNDLDEPVRMAILHLIRASPPSTDRHPIDHADSKDLPAHHRFLQTTWRLSRGLFWPMSRGHL